MIGAKAKEKPNRPDGLQQQIAFPRLNRAAYGIAKVSDPDFPIILRQHLDANGISSPHAGKRSRGASTGFECRTVAIPDALPPPSAE
jgi:hypothetical protein